MLLLMLGCAPLYRPGIAPAPLFEEQGDLSAYSGVSLGGVQGGVAWAPVEHVGLRANTQLAAEYAQLSAGVGGWLAGPFDRPPEERETGLRLGLWADAGVGRSSGGFSVTFSGGSTSTTHLSGQFVVVGGQAVVAFEAPRAASGLSLRGAVFRVEHDAGSDVQGIGRVGFLEPTLFARAGGPRLKAELQLGGWIPVWVPEEGATTGLPLPLHLGLGLVYER